LEYHLDLAARLAPLRERGILIIASGNVVHNLRRVDRQQPDTGFDWAHRFDDAVHERMTSDASTVLAVRDHPDYQAAVPTPDHFLPLLYLAGLAASEGGRATTLLRGYSLGSLSMTAYGLGLPALSEQPGDGSADLPAGVPADNTNT
jgi:4,5-DOPA dioxygenase extradiol